MKPMATRERASHSILGLGYSLLIDSETTGGAYELMRFDAPAGASPPPHRHRHEDENFLIVEGRFEVSIDGTTHAVGPGDTLHLPRGKAHTFRNVGESMGSFLCWVVPGNLGGFFESFAHEWPAWEELPPALTDEDVQKMLTASEAYEIEIIQA